MTEQERMEEILRSIHVLLAEAEPVLDDDDLVVVDQQSLYRLLEELNRCMSDIMERYEVTQQAREAAENRTRRDIEKMVSQAQQTADDIYSASLLYMDGTLQEMNQRMLRMQKDIVSVTSAFVDDMNARMQDVTENREELKGQMHTLMEEETYLKLVKAGGKLWEDAQEDLEDPDEEDLEGPDEEDLEGYDPSGSAPEGPTIQIHTDSAYFKAKEEQNAADQE